MFLYLLHQQGSSKAAAQRRREVFTEKLKWDVVFLLDPAHPDGNDWRKLAHELGVPQHKIEVKYFSRSA